MPLLSLCLRLALVQWGGVPLETVADVLSNGSIIIPHMGLTPSRVNARGFAGDGEPPPEMEVRWDVEPPTDMDTREIDLWWDTHRPMHPCTECR